MTRSRSRSLVARTLTAGALTLSLVGGLVAASAPARASTDVSPTGSIGTTGPTSTTKCTAAGSYFTANNGDPAGPVGVFRAASGLFVTDYDGFDGVIKFPNPTSGVCPTGTPLNLTDSFNNPIVQPEAVSLSANEQLMFVSIPNTSCGNSAPNGCVYVYEGTTAAAGGGYSKYTLEATLGTANGTALYYPRGTAYDDADGLLFVADDDNDRVVIYQNTTKGFVYYDVIQSCACLYDVKAVAYQSGKLLVANFDGQVNGGTNLAGNANEVVVFDPPNGYDKSAYQPVKTVPVTEPIDLAFGSGTFLVSSFGNDDGADDTTQYDSSTYAPLATFDGVAGPSFGVAEDSQAVYVADGGGDRVLTYANPNPSRTPSGPGGDTPTQNPTPTATPTPSASTPAPAMSTAPSTASPSVSGTPASATHAAVPRGYLGDTKTAGVSPVGCSAVHGGSTATVNVAKLGIRNGGSGLRESRRSSIKIAFFGRAITLHFVRMRGAGTVTITLDGKKTKLNLGAASGVRDLADLLKASSSGKHIVVITVAGAGSPTAILWRLSVSG